MTISAYELLNKSANEISDHLVVMHETKILCTCQPDDLIPSNLVRGLCEACGLEISWEQMDRYNRHYGFSGYDEFHDDEEDGSEA